MKPAATGISLKPGDASLTIVPDLEKILNLIGAFRSKRTT
jgi:hypothetical protein